MKPRVKISVNESPFQFYAPDVDGVIRVHVDVPEDDIKVWAAYQIFDEFGRGPDSGLGTVFTVVVPNISQSEIPVFQFGANGPAPANRLLVHHLPIERTRRFITDVYFPEQYEHHQRIEIHVTRVPVNAEPVPEPLPVPEPEPTPDPEPEIDLVVDLRAQLQQKNEIIRLLTRRITSMKNAASEAKEALGRVING